MRGLVVALGLVFSALAAAARAGDPVLARVGGVPITATDLEAAFELRHEGHMSLLADETVVQDFLDAVVEQALFVLEARRLGLDRTEDFQAFRRRELRRFGVRWLYETEVRDKVRVGRRAIRRAVERMRAGWEVIRIQTDTREEAEGARERVLAGEDASRVAREVSTARSRLRGGLELIQWGEESPEVEARLWRSAPGELTEPLETADGWTVFQVIAKRQVPLPESPEARAREILRRREAERLRDRFLDRLRRHYRARLYEQRLDLGLLERALAGQTLPRDPVLASFEGGELTLSQLAAAMDARMFGALRAGLKPLRARQFLSDRLDLRLLEHEAERRWPRAPRELQAKLRAAEEAWLYRKLLADVVFANIQVTAQEIRDWYEVHRDELREPARVLLSVALLPDEAAARAFLEALAGGSVFAQLARERSLDDQTALRGGRTVWITREELRPEIPEDVFEVPAGTVGGPVRLDEGWLVYRVEDRREARRKTLEEATPEVRERILEQKREARLRAWAERLREATPVEYFARRIARAARRLARAPGEAARTPASAARAAETPP